MSKIVRKFNRVLFYIKRKAFLKYVLLKLVGGYKILHKGKTSFTIQTRFDKIIFELPATNDTYLYVANPINELLLSTFINIERGTFIDVGAFIGKHTIRCAKNSKARIIAIEPNPISLKILKQNIVLNKVQANIKVVEAALVGDEATTKISLTLDYDRSKITSSSERIDSALIVNAISFNKLIETHNIDTTDDVLMKIDIEGYEFELLKSMREFLANSTNKFRMVCEILHYSSQKAETINFLESLNFSLLPIDNENYFIYKK